VSDRPEVAGAARAGHPVPAEAMRCPLCGAGPEAARLRFAGTTNGADAHVDPGRVACTSSGHRHHPPIHRCQACGLLYSWPRPTTHELVEAYRGVEDPLYVTEKENRYFTFRRVLSRLGPAHGRRLLDVGAYCGYFVDVAREAGFDAEGIELSRWAAAQARGLGIQMREETLAQSAAAGHKYDVVTMWDVVEHFADPLAEVRHAATMLLPGGELHLSTIDAGSAAARAMGKRWPWLMDMHLCYFDRRTIRRLVEDAGLELVSIRLYSHVVSMTYVFTKLAATWRRPRPFTSRLARWVPAGWRIPVNIGDNIHVIARQPR
jgi:hypothetical protein